MKTYTVLCWYRGELCSNHCGLSSAEASAKAAELGAQGYSVEVFAEKGGR
jgi:hypothetical protein